MRSPFHRPARAAMLAATATALMATQQACGSATEPTAGAASSPPVAPTLTSAPPATANAPEPTPTGAPAADAPTSDTGTPILDGERQVVIRPLESFESILALDEKGTLTLIEGDAEHTLFVLEPVNGLHQIQTAKESSGGEAACLGLKDNGTSAPMTLAAAACDTSASGQLFTVEELSRKDPEGGPTYAIMVEGRYLQAGDSQGVEMAPVGDGEPDTPIIFVDNGEADQPRPGR